MPLPWRSPNDLCAYCHLSPAVTDPQENSRNMFLPGTHGLALPPADDSRLARGLRRDNQGLGDGEHPLLPGDYIGYPKKEESTKRWLDCTSCHDVHHGAWRPFLRRYDPLDTDLLGSLCLTCHQGRVPAGSGKKNVNELGFSAHPPEARPMVIPAWIVPADYAGMSVPSVPTWKLGGHLDPIGRVSCVTCHAVHGADPVGGGAPPREHLLALPAEELCTGCHRPRDGNKPPLHWAGLKASAPGKSLGGRVLPPSKVSAGKAGLTCLSCHDVHFGSPGTACLAVTPAGSNVDSFCQLCHERHPYHSSQYVSEAEFLRRTCTSCHEAHGCPPDIGVH